MVGAQNMKIRAATSAGPARMRSSRASRYVPKPAVHSFRTQIHPSATSNEVSSASQVSG